MNAFERLTLNAISNPEFYNEKVGNEVLEGFCEAVKIMAWIEEESR